MLDDPDDPQTDLLELLTEGELRRLGVEVYYKP